MRSISQNKQFRKDLKRVKKQKKDTEKLKTVIDLLFLQQELPAKYRDHFLKGNYANCRECHLEPDWLLIYEQTPESLYLIRTGSHSELFRK